MADGFLGRWSKRKLDAKEGKPVDEAPPAPRLSPASGAASAATVASAAVPPSPQREEGRGEAAAAAERQQPSEPPPTLDDVKALTPDSDFSRFVRADVAPEVKNSALKKLFADPRFNVQDGLDVYIDDYGKPDPIPEAMLRQLAGAKFLGLFRDDERKDEAQDGARDVAEGAASASVAQSAQPADAPANSSPPAVPPDHADPDLRLQQDDAAEGGGDRHGDR